MTGRTDGWDVEALVDHIVSEHHGYVRESLPGLRQLTAKIARVHGARHEELHEIRVPVDVLGRREAVAEAAGTAPVEATGSA